MTASQDVLRHAIAEGYREMPSVWSGGSPVFYFRRHPDTDQRQWIICHRGVWTHRLEDSATGHITSWPFWTLGSDDADSAADEAENMTGLECVIVDDVTPRRRRA